MDFKNINELIEQAKVDLVEQQKTFDIELERVKTDLVQTHQQLFDKTRLLEIVKTQVSFAIGK